MLIESCCGCEGSYGMSQQPKALPHGARMAAFSHLVMFVQCAVGRYVRLNSTVGVSAGAGSCAGPDGTCPAAEGTASAAAVGSSGSHPSLQLSDIQRCLAAVRMAATSLLSNSDLDANSELLPCLGSAILGCSQLPSSDTLPEVRCAPPNLVSPVALAVAVQLLPPLCAAVDSVVFSSIQPVRDAAKAAHAGSSSYSKAGSARERHDAIHGSRQRLKEAVFDGQVGPCTTALTCFSAAACGPWMSSGPWDVVGASSSSSSSQLLGSSLDLLLAMQAAGVPRALKTIADVMTKLTDGQVGLSAAELSTSDLGTQSVQNITTQAAEALLTPAVACLDTLLQLGAAASASLAAPVIGGGCLPDPLGGSGAAVASAAVACSWCADVLDSGLLGAVLHVIWQRKQLQQPGSTGPGANEQHGSAEQDGDGGFGDAELVVMLSRLQCCLLECASRLGAAAMLPCETPLRNCAPLHVDGTVAAESSTLDSHLAAFEQEARRAAIDVARYAAASAAEASRAAELPATSSDQAEATVMKGLSMSEEARTLGKCVGIDIVNNKELAATVVAIAALNAGKQGGSGGGGSGAPPAPPSPTMALAEDILQGSSSLARTLRQAAAASLKEEVEEAVGSSEPVHGAAQQSIPAPVSPERAEWNLTRGVRNKMSSIVSHALGGWGASPSKEQPGLGTARGPSLPPRRTGAPLTTAPAAGRSGPSGGQASAAGCMRYLGELLEDGGGGGRSRCHALLQAMGSDWGLVLQASCEEPVAGLCCSLGCRGNRGGSGDKAAAAVHLCAAGCGAWYCSQACLTRGAKGHAASCKVMPRVSADDGAAVTDLEALD